MNSTVLQHHSKTCSVIFVVVHALLVLTVFVCGAGAELMIYGVVNAPTTLPCSIKTGFDAERVIWTVNSSAEPLVSYFPKDGIISPPDHDQRLSTSDASKLEFSFLRKNDSGTYTCIVTATGLEEDLTYAVNMTVLDGCPIWSHAPLLLASGEGCLPGETFNYAHRCNFTCQPGFQLIGNKSTECLSNGELSNGLPTCERIICTISSLPSHLVDKQGICVNESQVGYGTTCNFECTVGYHLNGIGTVNVTCIDEDDHVDDFPECQEEVGPQNLGFIAFAFVPFVLIPLVVWWFIKTKKGKQKERTHDSGECIPLANKPINTQSADNANGGEQRLTQMNDDGFVDFVIQQVRDSRKIMTRILRILKDAEFRIVRNLPTVGQKENELGPNEYSISETFASYVTVIVRCVQRSDQEIADEVINDLFSATGDNASLYSKMGKSTASFEQEDIQGIQENQSYFTVVHSAFLKLLVALRFNIEDITERSQRSAGVFREMVSYFKAQQEESGVPESKSSMNTSTPSSFKGSTGSNGLRSNQAFAEICLRNITKCTSVEDGIRMRYNILNIMIASKDTDVIQSNISDR